MSSASWTRGALARRVQAFWRAESAQDLTEYALLALFLGLALLVVWGQIANLIGLNYEAYQADVPALWEPPPP